MDEQEEIRAYAKILAVRWSVTESTLAEQGVQDFIDGDPLTDVLLTMARKAMREHHRKAMREHQQRERDEQEKSGRAGGEDSAA